MMLRTRILPLLRNKYNVLAPIHDHSSSLHTSQIFGRKQKKGQEKCSEPVSVAVILSGCGNLDGTEISEAISATIHISQKKWTQCFYAPNMKQCCVIDHCSKEVDKGSPRNAMIEGARIARSAIKPLCECDVCKHAALVIPGGMGAAQTLSNFAEKGADCKVLPELQKLIEGFYCEKKPIASLCIASALVARVLEGVTVTLGKDSPKGDWPHHEAIEKVKKMGATVEMKGVTEVAECKKFKVLSTPAWLYKCATHADIHNGAGKLIAELEKCMKK